MPLMSNIGYILTSSRCRSAPWYNTDIPKQYGKNDFKDSK